MLLLRASLLAPPSIPPLSHPLMCTTRPNSNTAAHGCCCGCCLCPAAQLLICAAPRLLLLAATAAPPLAVLTPATARAPPFVCLAPLASPAPAPFSFFHSFRSPLSSSTLSIHLGSSPSSSLWVFRLCPPPPCRSTLAPAPAPASGFFASILLHPVDPPWLQPQLQPLGFSPLSSSTLSIHLGADPCPAAAPPVANCSCVSASRTRVVRSCAASRVNGT